MSTGVYESVPPWSRIVDAIWCIFSEWGLSYQSCRFCRRGIGDFPGLWKYSVRHYICPDCYDRAKQAQFTK